MAAGPSTYERLGPGAEAYARDIYHGHIDEASFLYERWNYAYDDLRFRWDELVDLAAALAPVMLAMAALGVASALVPTPVLVWASSGGPERSAALLSATGRTPIGDGARTASMA